ncbi:MAG: hypothetical protein QCI38_05505, partial [Candidatus Thermoplasmatota archaeon]|nr:hypothetical protein [Candidatus Thermoplasmatota archaeon]
MPPNEDLVHLMVSLLGLSSKAKEDKGAIENVKPDIFLRDGKNSYIINVAGVATLEKLSMLTLLKDMMKDGKAHYFLAAKVFPTTVLGAAKKAGIG